MQRNSSSGDGGGSGGIKYMTTMFKSLTFTSDIKHTLHTNEYLQLKYALSVHHTLIFIHKLPLRRCERTEWALKCFALFHSTIPVCIIQFSIAVDMQNAAKFQQPIENKVLIWMLKDMNHSVCMCGFFTVNEHCIGINKLKWFANSEICSIYQNNGSTDFKYFLIECTSHKSANVLRMLRGKCIEWIAQRTVNILHFDFMVANGKIN